jgi:hypothetical protein
MLGGPEISDEYVDDCLFEDGLVVGVHGVAEEGFPWGWLAGSAEAVDGLFVAGAGVVERGEVVRSGHSPGGGVVPGLFLIWDV